MLFFFFFFCRSAHAASALFVLNQQTQVAERCRDPGSIQGCSVDPVLKWVSRNLTNPELRKMLVISSLYTRVNAVPC